MLDAFGRPCDNAKAVQASIQGCIRIAPANLCPQDATDARDLDRHAATQFQIHIGYGITTYDHDAAITREQAAHDLRKAAQAARATTSESP